MEKHFNSILKELPYPLNLEKKKLSILMHYGCYKCGAHTGLVKDRKWTKWLHFAIGGAMAGVGIATLNTEMGVKGIKKLYSDFTQSPLERIPKEGFLLTTEERDRMLSQLRDSKVFDHLHYCPACDNWVCDKCFDFDALACKKCS